MSDDARDLLDRFWEYHVQVDDHRPLWESDIDQIERWPSTSQEHTAEVSRRMRAFRTEALDRMDSNPEAAPSLRTAADTAQLFAAELDVEVELSHPHPSHGLHSYFFWAVNNFPLRTADHGRRYIDKMRSFPAAIDELRERLSGAAAGGRAPLTRHSRMTVDNLDEHLASAISDDPLMQQPAPSELRDSEAAAWRDELSSAIAEDVRPALERMRDTLRDTAAPAGRSDASCGLLHLPDGEAIYAELVEGYTAEGVTPTEVHETGLAQVERLAEEYRDLGASVLGTSDLGEIFSRLRDDPELHYTSADEIVQAATALHARAQERAPSWFLRTPSAPCEVRATEHGSLAFYSPPAIDGSRPGVFFFNTSNPQMWGPQFAATVFHEGIPGHHFQVALAREQTDLHEMHRNAFLPAYGEGWALYTERLADEMGLYPTDTDRLGILASDSLRACRLVVDTGMHALGWSRQQAIDYLLENSPLGRVEVTAEVDRYIGRPGQATSYMIGRLEIQRLRDVTAERLGDRFELPAFHDLVLSQGMVSLPALQMMVSSWDGRRVDA